MREELRRASASSWEARSFATLSSSCTLASSLDEPAWVELRRRAASARAAAARTSWPGENGWYDGRARGTLKSGGAGVKNEHPERLALDVNVNDEAAEDGSVFDGLETLEELVDDPPVGIWLRPGDAVWSASLSESGLSAQGERKVVFGLRRAEDEFKDMDEAGMCEEGKGCGCCAASGVRPRSDQGDAVNGRST